MSGWIYLDIEDFQRAGRILKGLCERVVKGEYLVGGEKVNQKRVVKGGALTLDSIGADS